MRFLIDAQLPPALARALAAAGHSASPARELGLREADDEAIWNYAVENQFVIVTKDEDFALRVWRTTNGSAVVWLRMGNCSNKVLLEKLMPLLDEVVERLKLGDRLVEVS